MRQRKLSFAAIGTRWLVQAQTNLSDHAWRDLRVIIFKRIDEFDKTYSRFKHDSMVTQLAQTGGTVTMPPDAHTLLAFYEQLYTATGGSVTPLIGQTMVDAGYDANYSLQAKPLLTPPRWEAIIQYDDQQLTLAQPALLDFGAAGKGYLVDIVGELLTAAGIQIFLINAGGDIVHRTSDGAAMTIGLENPHNTSEVIGVAQLRNQSLCASAGSRRAWGQYHHIIDPRSLRSPQDVLATWVIADDTLTADGLATALFLVPPISLRQFHFSYAMLRADMSLERSASFPLTAYEVAT